MGRLGLVQADGCGVLGIFFVWGLWFRVSGFSGIKIVVGEEALTSYRGTYHTGPYIWNLHSMYRRTSS